MKKLIIICCFCGVIGCDDPNPVPDLFVGYQIDYYPTDKNKTGIYDHYTLFSRGGNLRYDTTIKVNDTIALTYFGELRDLHFYFVKKDSGFVCIKSDELK